MKRGAFTLLELLLILGIVVVLLAIIVPYAASIREASQRVACAERLRQVRDGMQRYILTHTDYPRVIATPDSAGYTAYTGIDDAKPFELSAGEDVQPNDVTASLWLLMRTALVPDPGVFVCPSTWDSPDPLTNKAGIRVGPAERGNFRSPEHLSYSYASPFAKADQFGMRRDNLPADFALMADMNPGAGMDGTFPVRADASEGELAVGNSTNHNRAGQNVLYADGSVRWHESPYVGFGYTPATATEPMHFGDNIFSALSVGMLPVDHVQPKDAPGFTGRSLAPAYAYDSYLVPSVLDE